MKRLIALTLTLVMVLSLCACGGVDERYTTLIECLDAHDYEGAAAQVMMLRQQAIDNGDIVVVEPQDEDRELVNRYHNVGYFLMNYTPDSYQSIYNEETDEHLSGNDGLAFAYAELQALESVDQWLNSEYFSFEDGFPTDRQALLDRFAIVENQLLKATRSTVDNMGNENTDRYWTWFYDEAGTLTMENIGWSAADRVWENIYSRSGYYRYSYNDAGVITETKITDQENTSVNALIKPTYDEAGNLVSETITDNNGEYVFTYTYDANGNLIQTDYVDDWYDYTVFYTYDEAGNLIQKDRCRNGSMMWNSQEHTYVSQRESTVNTYDGSGKVVSAVITDTEYTWNIRDGQFLTEETSHRIDTVSYTYDAEGRVLQEVWQYGTREYTDGDTNAPEYSNQTIDYSYGDYYIFN